MRDRVGNRWRESQRQVAFKGGWEGAGNSSLEVAK